LISGWAGVEVAGVFYDARSEQQGLASGTVTGQRVTNNMVGAGPHAGLALWRDLPYPGLRTYGAVEGASLYSALRQSFEETFLTPGVGGSGATQRYPTSQGVGVIGFRLGLSWSPPENGALRFFLGYQFNEWYQLGRNENNGSQGHLTEHGLFVRGEYTF
jgi:hypothetical protein